MGDIDTISNIQCCESGSKRERVFRNNTAEGCPAIPIDLCDSETVCRHWIEQSSRFIIELYTHIKIQRLNLVHGTNLQVLISDILKRCDNTKAVDIIDVFGACFIPH